MGCKRSCGPAPPAAPPSRGPPPHRVRQVLRLGRVQRAPPLSKPRPRALSRSELPPSAAATRAPPRTRLGLFFPVSLVLRSKLSLLSQWLKAAEDRGHPDSFVWSRVSHCCSFLAVVLRGFHSLYYIRCFPQGP